MYSEGLTKGHAFVYMRHESDVEKVIEYVDGRHLRNRQIRASKYVAKGVTPQKR